MDCPFCDATGARSEIHRHLAEVHGDQVSIAVDEERGRRTYGITCPVCGAPWERQIKPRYRDPAFIDEFAEEIKLVAFDMLLYHMQGEHEATGQTPVNREEPG